MQCTHHQQDAHDAGGRLQVLPVAVQRNAPRSGRLADALPIVDVRVPRRDGAQRRVERQRQLAGSTASYFEILDVF